VRKIPAQTLISQPRQRSKSSIKPPDLERDNTLSLESSSTARRRGSFVVSDCRRPGGLAAICTCAIAEVPLSLLLGLPVRQPENRSEKRITYLTKYESISTASHRCESQGDVAQLSLPITRKDMDGQAGAKDNERSSGAHGRVTQPWLIVFRQVGAYQGEDNRPIWDKQYNRNLNECSSPGEIGTRFREDAVEAEWQRAASSPKRTSPTREHQGFP